jgi:hypothetical protein
MFNTRPEGKRGTGKPKLRSGYSVDHAIRILRERNWRNLASNREWRKKHSKKARTHEVPPSQQ